jgi:hypothetical protein
MSETGFDLQAWKKQAEEEYKKICIRETELVAHLAKVQTQKEEFEKALGLKTKSALTRRRFRPVIQRWAESCESVSSTAETILEELFDGEESLLEGLKTSLTRLAKEDTKYHYDTETEILSYPVE